MRVGIEAIHPYAAPTYISVRELFEQRKLDLSRFDNLMMRKKAVALPCEDPVTHAVNAAKPIVQRLSDAQRNRIELVVLATESGIDFGKAMSSYVHQILELPKSCRTFETKHACYAGTAALQMAAAFVRSGASPGAKALVIATDVASALDEKSVEILTAAGGAYHEPSGGTGAVAMLVGEEPNILELDAGAHGFHSYEVMDTCRPVTDHEIGDPDLSLLSYIDCLEGSFADYARRVEGADYVDTFDYIAYHTPFAGMVKGAHRKMMRKHKGASPDEIEDDFEARVAPSLKYCVEVGNVYSATVFLALCGVVANSTSGARKRVGMFSYGSGCSSEFYSGILSADAHALLGALEVDAALAARHELSFEEYKELQSGNAEMHFGIRDLKLDTAGYGELFEKQLQGKGYLVLDRIERFHREYRWS